MDNLWILFIFIYAFLKGSREGMKKAALRKSSSNEILFFYTLVGFILVAPFSWKAAFATPPAYIFYTFIKAAVCCAAWIFAFLAIGRMSVSLYGIMDLSRMIFSTLLGIVVLGEDFTLPKAIGVTLVITGLLLVNAKKQSRGTKETTVAAVIATLLSCFLNAISGTMDKVLMKDMNSSQLQFWFMLFMAIIYAIVLCIKKEKISVKCLKNNYWIPIMSLSLIIGDKLLFEANAYPGSQITLMTIIKQSAVLVTILTGWLVFKEKHILYKTMCGCIVVAGILIALLF